MHALIVGIINTGKTTLAVHLAADQIKERPVLWYSPISDPRIAGVVTRFISDRDEFLKLIDDDRFKNCLVIFDESSQTLAPNDKEASDFVTVARHHGHQVIVIAQRAKQVNKTAREQCSQVYCFRQGPDDAEDLARQFVHPGLRGAVHLKKGEYLHAISTGGIWRGDLKLN